LAAFVVWVEKNIRGDEKGEAQIFLDRLFQAFGQEGVFDAGGHCEFRIRKAKEDGGGTAFADCVWKPIVLIEMKKRGENLNKHFRQAFDYWVRLVPGRPRYVVLCNFDEFWVYDFETQMDTPVDQLALTDLPKRCGPLAFLFPTRERPVFGNDQEAVTREAADRLAVCFNKLIARNVARELAQRFVLQTLVALFSEDIGLLEQYTFARLLDDCEKPSDAYDLIGGLFVEMNTKGETPGGRFKGVAYFNGGVFSDPARLELYPDELSQLREAAKADWSKVRPEIFGTLFEHSLDQKERHAFGAHFTHPADIMKIITPTIVEPWRDAIEKARTLERLAELQNEMHHLQVLDPACGSGNFLYIAYRELKRLEARLYERMHEISKSKKRVAGQRAFGFVTARQFHGMDINPFAVELAKVTMMIGRKLAIDELHINEPALPLDNLDTNFIAADALIDAEGKPAAWPRADVIIGNPPFLGAKRLKPEHGPDYVNALRNAYPDVPGMADYCVYWFRKTHDHLPDCTSEHPFSGRAGLVGTQNIRNNQSRVGGLDYIVKTGTVVEAVDNQPWSGEANVHVSIANWVKTQDKKLLPKTRRLWYKLDTPKGAKRIEKASATLPRRDFEVACRSCDHINSALSDAVDVSSAVVLNCNLDVGTVCQGLTPGCGGFLLAPSERALLLQTDPGSADVIFPYLIGQDLLTGKGAPTRFLIDFREMSILDAGCYKGAFDQVKERVLPKVQKKAEREHASENAHSAQLKRWWLLWRPRTEFVTAISSLSRYMVCSRVTKRPIFVFVDSHIRPGDSLQAFAFPDDYSFGILQSNIHWLWFITKCSKLKSDFRYTPPTVFDTFPWPQHPNNAEIEAVAKAAEAVRHLRAEALQKTKGGLRAIYRLLELPGANPLKDTHSALDEAVLKAYGFSAKHDLLAQLLELNYSVAKRIQANEEVVGPGVPPSYPKPEMLVTEDCVRPELEK